MVIFHSYVKLPEGSGRIALILMTRDGLLGALKKYSKPLSPVLLANINTYLGIGQNPAANSPWADVADFCYLSNTI